MIGTRIETSGRITVGTWLNLIVFGILVAVGISNQDPFSAAWAALPLIFCVLRIGQTWRGFTAELTEEGISVGGRHELIRYATIENVTENGKPRRVGLRSRFSGPILVEHLEGTLVIPAGSTNAMSKLYDFLFSKIPESHETGPIPQELEKIRQEQVEQFGADRVFAYSVRQFICRPVAGDGARAFGLAMILWGILAAVLGNATDLLEDIDIAGGFMIGFGILFFVCGFLPLQHSRLLRKLHKRRAGLVVSPGGIAMIQHDVKGQLRWDELLDVTGQKAASFRISHAQSVPGIGLKVEGVTIAIADIYQRPIPIIRDRIVRYWRG